MKEKDVPKAWIDAAMTGASPGCRDDARFYLANAYKAIEDDLLWELTERDMYVTCACGMDWEPNAYQGPDHGHGRYECPAGAEACLRITKGQTVTELRIKEWRWLRLADFGGRTGRQSLTGWLGEDRSAWANADLYNGARLTYAQLPGGQVCPVGQRVHVEICGYGDDRGLFLKVAWDDQTR